MAVLGDGRICVAHFTSVGPLARVGLVVRTERHLAQGDVACTLWVCRDA